MTILVWLAIAAAVLWLAVASARLEKISDLKSFSSGFRRFLAVATAILIVGAVGWIGWAQAEDRERLREEETARRVITRQQIEFRNFRMGVGGPSVQLKGRIRNNNPASTLTRVDVRLWVLECDASYQCDTVLGDQTESIAVSVPPQETREISHDVFFIGLGATRLRRSWRYDVLSVSGN